MTAGTERGISPTVAPGWSERETVIAGLYVGDGSVFPSGIGVNPMITIMALARRLSRVILAET